MSNFQSRAIANSLLLIAGIGFGACLLFPVELVRNGIPLDLVRAIFEAALIGGLADWFAVTALFRHPLGIPVPHTAIIPHQKKKIAKAFGNFLNENFLKPEVLEKKFLQISLTSRLKAFVSEEYNKTKIVSFLTELNTVVDLKTIISSEKTAGYVQELIVKLALSPTGDRIVEAAINRVAELISKEEDSIRSQISKRLPWFIPSFVDEKLYSWFITSLSEWLQDWSKKVAAQGVRSTPQILHYLESDQFRLFISEALGSHAVSEALQGLTSAENWQKRVEGFVGKLESDSVFQAKMEQILQRSAITIANYAAGPFSRYVSKTIEQWDSKQASALLENQFGDDLQYIRINGTLLGGIIGGLLYLLNLASKGL